MRADLLADLSAAVAKGIEQGTGLKEFRADFRNIVEKRGWHGWTGEGTQAGEAWRTRIIFETNLRTSYAAGRYAQLTDPDLLQRRPYWKYIHADGVMAPRPQHLAWNGMVLPHDHPFWETHYPPNGWGCGCRVTAVRGPKEGDKTAPPEGWDAINPKTGAPVGIDKGWAYAPGKSVANELRGIVEQKAAKLPEPIKSAFEADMKSVFPAATGFEEQKTAKAAAEWAMKHNLADFADYTGIKPEVANAWNRSIYDHLQEFPELRKNLEFIGSAQAHSRQYADNFRKKIVEEAIKKGIPADIAEQYARKLVKTSRVPGTDYAHSRSGIAPGISVNIKYGKAPAAFTDKLRHDVSAGWHPVGCDTIRSVVDHELGHQLDGLLELSLDSKVKKLYKEAMAQGMKDAVSGYAAKNINEFIAESWSEYLNNPTPRPTAQSIGNIVRSRYAQRRSRENNAGNTG
ncbi:MAG: hypothetical protein LBQ81_06685 [Zoogloeaceae bacterium]|nr:hypothetical protein [Zoogloeaceae bacterium]